MRARRHAWRRTLPRLLAGLLVATALPASAQDRPRSDTGRRRPEPPPPPEPVERTAPSDAAPRAAWFATVGGGVGGGGRMFRAETVSGNPVVWPGAPFPAERIKAKLGAGPVFSCGIGRRLGDLTSLRLEFGWSDLDVLAESAVGQVGEVYTYDNLGVWEAGLGLEVDLARVPSVPYVGLGGVVQGVSGSLHPDLDQTNFGGQAWLGYRQLLSDRWRLRIEGRLTRTAFDGERHVPEPAPPTEVVVVGEDALTTWQVLVAVQLELGDPR